MGERPGLRIGTSASTMGGLAEGDAGGYVGAVMHGTIALRFGVWGCRWQCQLVHCVSTSHAGKQLSAPCMRHAVLARIRRCCLL
jgi:hypothetical protein